jgi:beta-lactamase regulating signal transducer with metallopeptidase domain
MRIETFLVHPAVQVLGWSLLHFLWQGALLALLLWIIRLAVPSSAARVRYAAASLIMLLMPVALVITLARGFTQDFSNVNAAVPAPAAGFTSSGSATSGFRIPGFNPAAVANFTVPLPGSGRVTGIAGWAVCLWLAGVLILSLRAAGGWARAQRVKRGGAVSPDGLDAMLERLRGRLRVTAPVRLYESALVEVPTVIGWLRPYILLPVTALTGLNDAQMEAVLAHELAHIRRHDYLANLLQTAVETLLFYHPCVWWVGREMRREREHCCDDAAVAACGNAAEYAGALAQLEQIRGGSFEPALAATGGDLLGRIRRLLGQQPHEDRVSRSLGAIAAAVFVLFLTVAPALRPQNAAPNAAPPQPPSPPASVESAAPSAPANPAPPRLNLPAPIELNGKGTLSDLISQDQILQDQISQDQISREISGIVNGLAQIRPGRASERTPEERAKTVDFLLTLFDSEKNTEMKESILNYLAQSGDKRATDKLLSIARSDPNQEMRMSALNWIAQSQDPRSTDLLMSIVQSGASVEVRQAALNFLVHR